MFDVVATGDTERLHCHRPDRDGFFLSSFSSDCCAVATGSETLEFEITGGLNGVATPVFDDGEIGPLEALPFDTDDDFSFSPPLLLKTVLVVSSASGFSEFACILLAISELFLGDFDFGGVNFGNSRSN